VRASKPKKSKTGEGEVFALPFGVSHLIARMERLDAPWISDDTGTSRRCMATARRRGQTSGRAWLGTRTLEGS